MLLLTVISYVLFIYLIYAIYKLFYAVFCYKVAPIILSKTTNLKKCGNWAIVTGATDGIGKAFAEKLAKMRFNIILISRNPEKLESCKQELIEAQHVEVETIVCDFTKPEDYAKVAQQLSMLFESRSADENSIGVLVNNVGMSSEFPDFFFSRHTDCARIDAMINCNCLSMAKMTYLVLQLKQNRSASASPSSPATNGAGWGTNKGCTFINVSSYAGHATMPLLTLYSATKHFMTAFTRSISAEYSSQSGNTFLCLVPQFVVSKMSGKRYASLSCPIPRDYVTSAIQQVGVQTVTSGFLVHEILIILMDLIPLFVRDRLFFRNLYGVSRKYQEKHAK